MHAQVMLVPTPLGFPFLHYAVTLSVLNTLVCQQVECLGCSVFVFLSFIFYDILGTSLHFLRNEIIVRVFL